MADTFFFLFALPLIFDIIILIISFPSLSNAISSCGGPCETLNDCSGQLICINGKCNDDPDVGTNICSGGGGGGGSTPSPTTSTCQSSGTLICDGKSYPRFNCSPPVSSSTKAKLTNNDFDEGGDGGDPSECDGNYHYNEAVVALSTGWYDGGSRCGKMIQITASNGNTVKAKVVDECDSMKGCDKEHAYQPPCKNNIVDGSNAVWNALGLNINDGIVDITWSMA